MSKIKQTWIKNEQERKIVFLTLGITTIFLIFEIWYITNHLTGSFHTRDFKHFFKEFGSYARIAFLFVLSHYGLKFVLQKRYVDQWTKVKQGIVFLSRFARKWHVPVAIVSIGTVLIHAIGAILYGLKLDFQNISGLLSLLFLLPVAISGVFRYKKTNKKWHLVSGLGFGIIFMIHSFL